MNPGVLLSALQLADSALPIGRFVHSNGLEAWLRTQESISAELLEQLVEAVVSRGVAPLDGAAAAHAHSSSSLDELVELDLFVTARKLTPPARAASQSCGRQLAGLASALAPHDVLTIDFAAAVADAGSDGNVAVVAACLARGLGLSARDTVLIELRGAAASLLSASVRLGVLAPARAQVMLHRLNEPIENAADSALSLKRDEMHVSIPELELQAMLHRRADARLFAT